MGLVQFEFGKVSSPNFDFVEVPSFV